MLKTRSPKDLQQVVEGQLCAGCGVCSAVNPGAITMVDDLDQGRRPVFEAGTRTEELVTVCPGAGLRAPRGQVGPDGEGWGPVSKVWEGHAADPEVRFAGSSGGVATALGVWALERGQYTGILHSRAREDEPLLNHSVVSRSRGDLLAGAGSRYAPASPADGLGLLEESEGKGLFVGKPCDVAGVAMAAEAHHEPARRVGLTVAIFCAGAPSTRSTINYVRELAGVEPDAVAAVRYRGQGWPGEFVVESRDGDSARTSYSSSWGVLQAGRPWRCRICPDHTGALADISVGDPWHTPPDGEDPGRSLVVARTERGVQAIEDAIRSGHLELVEVPRDRITQAQPGLRQVTAAVPGRLLAMRLLGLPIPSYEGLGLDQLWTSQLSLPRRLKEVLSTVRRALRYGLLRARPVVSSSDSGEVR